MESKKMDFHNIIVIDNINKDKPRYVSEFSSIEVNVSNIEETLKTKTFKKWENAYVFIKDNVKSKIAVSALFYKNKKIIKQNVYIQGGFESKKDKSWYEKAVEETEKLYNENKKQFELLLLKTREIQEYLKQPLAFDVPDFNGTKLTAPPDVNGKELEAMQKSADMKTEKLLIGKGTETYMPIFNKPIDTSLLKPDFHIFKADDSNITVDDVKKAMSKQALVIENYKTKYPKYPEINVTQKGKETLLQTTIRIKRNGKWYDYKVKNLYETNIATNALNAFREHLIITKLRAEIPEMYNPSPNQENTFDKLNVGVTEQDVENIKLKAAINRSLKISFDFDSTLSEKPMQDLAKKFIKLGADVWIVTSRATEMVGRGKLDNDDLFQVADSLGIKRKNIIFTSYEDKYKYLKDFDLHLDDDTEEIFLINQFPIKCVGFLYEQKPDKQL